MRTPPFLSRSARAIRTCVFLRRDPLAGHLCLTLRVSWVLCPSSLPSFSRFNTSHFLPLCQTDCARVGSMKCDCFLMNQRSLATLPLHSCLFSAPPLVVTLKFRQQLSGFSIVGTVTDTPTSFPRQGVTSVNPCFPSVHHPRSGPLVCICLHVSCLHHLYQFRLVEKLVSGG